MRTLRSDGAFADDAFTRVRALKDDEPLPEGDLLLPLAVWQSRQDALRERSVGVWLENTVEPDTLDDAVLSVPLLAVDFPAFNDGRGLSIAVLLRSRRHYSGDLRAVGDVQPDQLSYMRRCGFSSFELAPNADISAAARQLRVMSEYYQGSTVDPLPLYRRR